MFEGEFIIIEFTIAMRSAVYHVGKLISEAITSHKQSWPIIQLTLLHVSEPLKAQLMLQILLFTGILLYMHITNLAQPMWHIFFECLIEPVLALTLDLDPRLHVTHVFAGEIRMHDLYLSLSETHLSIILG